MDNNKIPPLEPENHQPDELPAIPEKMEALEDLPVIEELAFEQEPQVEKNISDDPLPFEAVPEEPVIGEITFPEEILPQEPVCFETESPQEEITAEETTSLPPFQPEIPEVMEPVTAEPDPEDDFFAFLESQQMPVPEPAEESVPEAKDLEFQDHSQDFEKLMKEPEPQPEVTPEPQPEPTPEVTPEPQPEA